MVSLEGRRGRGLREGALHVKVGRIARSSWLVVQGVNRSLESEREIKEEAQESQWQWGHLLGHERSSGEVSWGSMVRSFLPAPAAIHLLQVLVPERACPLCYCPWLLPCHLPLRCCGAGNGGLEDLHSAQCHSGQRTGADLEVGPHCVGPLKPGGRDLGTGCSHTPRLVYRLHLHPPKLSAR